MSCETTITSFLPSRSLRHGDTDTNEDGVDEASTSEFYDFVIAAATIPWMNDPSVMGCRSNAVTSSGSLLVGSGGTFSVRLLGPEFPMMHGPCVAIKLLVDPRNPRAIRAACRELRILCHPPIRNHRNIVDLLGVAWMPATDTCSNSSSSPKVFPLIPALVVEMAPVGSVEEVWALSSTAQSYQKLTATGTKIEICYDVAQGLKVLHDCDIVHGDVKAHNILLFQDEKRPHSFIAKVADFGHSITELEDVECLRGCSPPWNAPEDNGSLNFIGLKCADMYSLGLLLWRIFADGRNCFQINAEGDMASLDDVEELKHSDVFVETLVKMLAPSNDPLLWVLLEKNVKDMLSITLNINPIQRSLSAVLSIVDFLTEILLPKLGELRERIVENLVYTRAADGQVTDVEFNSGIIREFIAELSEAEVKKSEQQSKNLGLYQSRLGGIPLSVAFDDKSESSNSDKEPNTRVLLYPTITPFDEDEIIRHRKACPFPNLVGKTEAEHFSGYGMAWPSIPLEDMCNRRAEFRDVGLLPRMDRTIPRISEMDFTKSDAQYNLGPPQKPSKAFLVEGISFVDPSMGPLITRLHKEHPGSSVQFAAMDTDVLFGKNTEVALDCIGRPGLKISVIKNIETELLQLISENSGFVTEDEKRRTKNVQVLLRSSYSSVSLSDTKSYGSLIGALKDTPTLARQCFVDSLLCGYPRSPKGGKRMIAQILFVYYLEIENSPEEAVKWLAASALEGDYIAKGIVNRVYTSLGIALPQSLSGTEWTWECAVAGSRIALLDLQRSNEDLYIQAHQILNGRNGGLGINVFDDFDGISRALASEILRIEVSEDSRKPVGVEEHIVWAREILSDSVPYLPNDPNCWTPRWPMNRELDKSEKMWNQYAKTPNECFHDVFRIESDIVYFVNAIGDTVIHYAASRGYLKLLKWLYKKYEPPYQLVNTAYETPLLQAMRAGHADIVEFLLDEGADPTYPSRRGELPIHWLFAIEPGRLGKIARRLSKASLTKIATYPSELHKASGREMHPGTYYKPGSALTWMVTHGNTEALSHLLSIAMDLKTEDDEDAMVKAMWSAAQTASQLWEAAGLSLILSTLHQYDRKNSPEAKEKLLYRCAIGAANNCRDIGLLTLVLRHGDEKSRDAAFQATIKALVDAGVRPQPASNNDNDEDTDDDETLSVIEAALWTAPIPCVSYLLKTGWTVEIGSEVAPGVPRTALYRERLFEELFSKTLEEATKTQIKSDVFLWIALGRNPSVKIAKQFQELGATYSENAFMSPFEFAVRQLQFDLADLFLETGAKIERLIRPKPAPEAFRDNLRELKELIADSDTVEEQEDLGDGQQDLFGDVHVTLLGALVAEYSAYLLPAIKYLLSRGAGPHVAKRVGSGGVSGNLNILHYAAAGRPEVPDRETARMLFPVLLDAYSGHKDLLSERDFIWGLTPLEWAVRAKNDIVVKILLEKSSASESVRASCLNWARDKGGQGMGNVIALLGQFNLGS